MMNYEKYKDYAPTILRVFLGILFLLPGMMKLMDPSGITGMLEGIGFPIAAAFAWILIIVEVLGGLMLITGYKIRWAVRALIIVLLVAMFTVTIPNMNGSAMNLLFHLVGIAGLASLCLSGEGAFSLEKKLA